ncbi:uncharacterized protein LOC126999566 isoform X2 [Eriocheir sinensis]|uniref:uncharacterized protein LOC126999566 isoform X2 n=1 Tax=Eriocheir sinensis TaxID=95602 RepID=UPI0021CAAD37|nr:uncharacterized protein LOC126999566 isoform X2 [Eriocheir sinensis]
MMEQLPQYVPSLEMPRSLLSRPAVLGVAAGFLVPILLPFFHFGIISHLWDEFNYKVDTRGCSCSCWDTVFKGIYERGPAGYKHVYFNVTANSLKIWMVTILAVLLLYEGIKRLTRLYLCREVRISMAVLFVSSIYPHYYSWWSYFNYWNDDFYSQWNHQLFFSITELVSTAYVAYLMDKNVGVTASRALVIMDIAILHIATSGFDQFVSNVVQGNGRLHQVLRDIFFMVPDLLHLTLPFLELRKVARSRNLPTAHMISNKEFFSSVAFVLSGWFVCLIL